LSSKKLFNAGLPTRCLPSLLLDWPCPFFHVFLACVQDRPAGSTVDPSFSETKLSGLSFPRRSAVFPPGGHSPPCPPLFNSNVGRSEVISPLLSSVLSRSQFVRLALPFVAQPRLRLDGNTPFLKTYRATLASSKDLSVLSVSLDGPPPSLAGSLLWVRSLSYEQFPSLGYLVLECLQETP